MNPVPYHLATPRMMLNVGGCRVNEVPGTHPAGVAELPGAGQIPQAAGARADCRGRQQGAT